MRYTLVAITAATALSVAACGSSGHSTPAASKSSPGSAASSSATAAPQAAKDHVAGMIASVSGNTIQVNQKNGAATVDITGSTKIAELTPAQLTDLTPGSCVTARMPRNNASAPARMVVIGAAGTGGCASPQTARAGVVHGTVASVNGNAVVVNVNQNGGTSQANVPVDGATTYKERASATSDTIIQGKCLAARGTKDGSGALQATMVTVAPAVNGRCPGAGR